LGENNYLAIG